MGVGFFSLAKVRVAASGVRVVRKVRRFMW